MLSAADITWQAVDRCSLNLQGDDMSAPRVNCRVCKRRKHSEIFSACMHCNLDGMSDERIVEFYLALSAKHEINLMRWFCLTECADTVDGAYHAACLTIMAGYQP